LNFNLLFFGLDLNSHITPTKRHRANIFRFLKVKYHQNSFATGYLQSVGAKSEARLPIYKVQEPKPEARLAIYRVWERKCNCILHPDLNCNPDQHGSGEFYLYITGLIQNATIKFIT